MGNCISTISDNRLNRVFQWLEEKGCYNHDLEKNLDSLEVSMVDLMVKQERLLRRLKREEDTGLQRLPEVQVWLDKVETMEQKVNALLSDRDVELQKLYVCGFCYGYGTKVVLTLKEVEELKSEDFEVIADQAQTSEVQERPLQRIIVGQETMLEKSCKHLIEDGVGIMGMYGVGGVGKTTLLTQMKNKLSYNYGFDFVIWVLVSKELQLEKIQDEIAHKVYLYDRNYGPDRKEWNKKDKSEKGIHIFNFLSKKRFILFLDDIWEKVDLAEIGVPDPRTQKGCKVAFTTRSQDVCSCMGVEDPMEVQCLAENEAFDLFQKMVGEKTLGSDLGISDLARIVAKKCCGIPLAINVISKIMSCKRTIQEWRHAIHVLSLYSSEFSGMEDKILPLLKYSYDSLKGEDVKSCLLYCALFPEDAKIPKEGLIEYWICEGIIEGSEDIEMDKNKSYDIIGSLVRASLLMEEFDRDGKGYVRMHDVVREMALWIASDLGKQKEAFIVRADVGLHATPNVENWKVVRRMSLMNNKIHHMDGSHKCLELTTLLLQRANLSNISSEFFKSMPKLAALDISFNENLSDLPEEISNLVSLKYLNLSHTGILELSKGLQELKKLIHLDLEVTKKLKSIGGISSLHNLKVLKLYDSRFTWDLNTVGELEALEHLEVLTIEMDNRSPVMKHFLSSKRLMSCTQSVGIYNLKSSGISLPETMDKLRKFDIYDCSISEIKMGRKCSFSSLVKVRIKDCGGLRELTFLMFAPNLRNLKLNNVYGLEDIINKEKACEVENSGIHPFQKLTEIDLRNLYQLKNIYRSPLPFPCLERIIIENCQYLKKLPLDSKSAKLQKPGSYGFFIAYDTKEWIESVEWEDEATKNRFLPFCQQDYRYLEGPYVSKEYSFSSCSFRSGKSI